MANLVIVEPSELTADNTVTLSDGRASHLRDVLRVSPGQPVRIGVLDGPFGAGTVTAVAADEVTLACAFEGTLPPRPRADLLLALPRPKVMRRLWAQLAALGVHRITLTNGARVERHYFETHVLSPGCYRPLLVEGLQQARDTRLPQVSIHRTIGTTNGRWSPCVPPAGKPIRPYTTPAPLPRRASRGPPLSRRGRTARVAPRGRRDHPRSTTSCADR